VRDAILAEVAASLSGSGSDSFTSLSGYVVLGASPPPTGAIRVDAATYGDVPFRWINTTLAGRFTTTATVALFYNTSGHPLGFGANNEEKWTIMADAAGTSSWKSATATARIVGGATNGLAIRNSGNTRDNFAITELGSAATLSDGTYSVRMNVGAASGELDAGGRLISTTVGHHTFLCTNTNGGAGTKAGVAYWNGTQWYSALEATNVAAGFGTLALMKSGGGVVIGTDPGGSNTLRAGGSLTINSSGEIFFGGRSRIGSPANGNINLTDAAGTDFGRLQFGGTASTFPSLKRSTTTLQVRLADDSNYGGFRADTLQLGGGTYFSGAADGDLRISNNAGTGFSNLYYGQQGGATTSHRIQKTVAPIADATATAVFTVTVPNGAHAALIRVNFSGIKGAGDAEGACGSVSNVTYQYAVQRTTGVTTTVVASAAMGAVATTIAAGNPVATTSDVSAVAGAVGDPQTFTIRVTITRTGGASTNHTCVAVGELVNANVTGISFA
jgi:hypothetical protein